MRKIRYRHNDFKQCPKCGGKINSTDEQTECIHCTNTLLAGFYYDKHGNSVGIIK